jgi:hypothetical protein
MRLLEGIPEEKYNDTEWVLDFLRRNPTIGNEKVGKIELFHCYWAGELNDLHWLSLKSLKEVHPDINVILWGRDRNELENSRSWKKIKSIWGDKIEIIEFSYDHLNQSGSEYYWEFYKELSDYPSNNGLVSHFKFTSASDFGRIVFLNLYGGVWFDLDHYFLRPLDSIGIKRYCSQWGKDICGNISILRLEKDHNLIPQIFKKDKELTTINPKLNFKLESEIDITILPAVFFDIWWALRETDPNFDKEDFFQSQNPYIPKEVYTYHWHNRWNYDLPVFLKNNL